MSRIALLCSQASPSQRAQDHDALHIQGTNIELRTYTLTQLVM